MVCLSGGARSALLGNEPLATPAARGRAKGARAAPLATSSLTNDPLGLSLPSRQTGQGYSIPSCSSESHEQDHWPWYAYSAAAQLNDNSGLGKGCPSLEIDQQRPLTMDILHDGSVLPRRLSSEHQRDLFDTKMSCHLMLPDDTILRQNITADCIFLSHREPYILE